MGIFTIEGINVEKYNKDIWREIGIVSNTLIEKYSQGKISEAREVQLVREMLNKETEMEV